jgi:tripartite-type tricarboxylate transporter receptor subunit TctC
MRMRAVLALAAGLCLAAAAARADPYPSRPITIVVPAAPGGVVDMLGRMLAQRFSEAWGQQAIVENRAGANNQIAAEYVAKSAPDGHTLFVAPEVTFVVNPFLYARLTYAPADFAPVVGLVSIQHALIAHPRLPADDLTGLITLARQKPLTYGTFGVGSSGHLNMELLQALTGARFTPVHYKGAAPAMTDVLGGHIDMMFVSMGSAVSPVEARHVKLLAVGRQRLDRFPGVAAAAESGLPGYEAVSWFALFAPAGTPRDVVVKINAEVQRAFGDPAFRKAKLDPQFFEPIAGSPEQLADRLAAESTKWRQVIRDANVKTD